MTTDSNSTGVTGSKTASRWRGILPEYATIVPIILISAGLFVFVRLTDIVLAGETGAFDRDILLWFRNPSDLSDPIGPAWLELVMRDMTALGGVLVLTLLVTAVVGYLYLLRHRLLALYVALAISAGTLLNTLLKELIARPRPDIVPHGTEAALSSFPSGHTMMSTMVYLTLGILLAMSSDDIRIKRYFLFWSILLAVLVGISRLYLGVHWPTDIIGGWIGGGVWAFLCLLVGRKFIRSHY